MVDIRTSINAASENHILRKMPEQYVDGFIQAAMLVYPPNQIDALLQRKFYIPNDSKFSVDSYLQSAAELSVQFHLARHTQVKNFAIEKQVKPPKDVDVYYEVGDVRVSLEVKCPVEETGTQDGLSLCTAGRVPDHIALFAEMQTRLLNADPPASSHLVKNKDNTLKDFLQSAHSKFSPDSGVRDVNMLLIACGGRSSMNKWFLYLTGGQGLFTPDSFISASMYNLVDVVILSNLKYFHQLGPSHHDWTLRNVLLIPVLNPSPRATPWTSSLLRALEPFEHHLKGFGHYRRTAQEGVPEDALNAVKLTGYVAEALSTEEQNRYFPVGLDGWNRP